MLDDQTITLLQLALRADVTSVADLARVAGSSTPDVVAAVGQLEALQLLQVEGGTLSCRSPMEPLVDHVRAMVQEQTKHLGDLDAMLATFPAIAHNWSLGRLGGSFPVHAEIVHGPDATEDLWRQVAQRGVPERIDAVQPDSSRFFPRDPERIAAFVAQLAQGNRRARCIVSTRDLADPDAAWAINANLEAGIELRMHPTPPSWFWVADGQIAALPLTWGDASPTSVVALYSEPIAAFAGHLFEDLWAHSVPVGPSDDNALLTLMAEGSTIQLAARALGISERTARRRISAAMDDHGVATLFALGRAWGATRSLQP